MNSSSKNIEFGLLIDIDQFLGLKELRMAIFCQLLNMNLSGNVFEFFIKVSTLKIEHTRFTLALVPIHEVFGPFKKC